MNIQVGKEREGDMIYTLETGEHVFNSTACLSLERIVHWNLILVVKVYFFKHKYILLK